MLSFIKGKLDWKCLPFILLIAFIFVARFKLIFSYSFDLDAAEYTYVHMIQRLLMGYDLYSDSLNFPFIAVVYTPLYFYGYYLICKLLHLHYLNDIHTIYIVGRALSFVVFIFQSVFIYKALARFNLSTFYRLLTLTLYAMLISGGFFVAKMDGCKVLFFTVFLLFLIDHFFYSQSHRSAILSLLAGIIAISIKQDAVIYITVCLITLLLLKPQKKVIVFCLGFVLATLSVFTIYYFVFGSYFFRNIIFYNFQVLTNLSIRSMNLIIIFLSLIRTGFPIMLCVLNLYLLYKRKRCSTPEMYVSVLAFVSFILSHITMLRPGAYLNYSYDCIVLLIFSSAVFIKEHSNYFSVPNYAKTILFAMYFLLLGVCNHFLHYYSTKETESHYRQALISYTDEKRKIDSVVGSSIVFFPNPKYAPLFADRNLIYGYEFHADRYINLLEDLKIGARLLFFDSKDYDYYFLTGKVKFIIAENKPVIRKHIQKYYSKYLLSFETKHFTVFTYK